MCRIDTDILMEALSVLTGATVKPLKDYKRGRGIIILTTDNYLPTIFGMLNDPLNPSANPAASAGLPEMMTTLSLTSPADSGATALRKELFVDMDDFFDPKFDYDFKRGKKDKSRCSRGGEPYRRPWGWYRFALKVLNKYPDGNAWLGKNGWRSGSDAEEWPVSFHGTSIKGAKGITSSNYTAGPREAYGRGIYSTPDIHIADTYAMSKKFTSRKNGRTYKVIMQNRINPVRRVKTAHQDYWLIKVPEGSSPAAEKKIVDESIRPYGILIKEV